MNENTNSSELTYRRQFVLSPNPIPALRTWKRVTAGHFAIAAHPDLPVCQTSNEATTLTLLGFILSPETPDADDKMILDGLLDRMDEPGDIFELLHSFGGRWILIISNKEISWLIPDAACLRSVTYFKSEEHGVYCASDTKILSDIHSLEIDTKIIKALNESSKYRDIWLPTDLTNYKQCYALLPNHYLDLKSGNCYRFWPTKRLSGAGIDEAASKSASILSAMLQAASNRFELGMGMTAGIDSRMLLASSKNNCKDIYYYTICRNRGVNRNSPDVRVPEKMLSQLGIRHHILDFDAPIDDKLLKHFNDNVTSPMEFRYPVAQGLSKSFPSSRVRVTSHVSEVARAFYRLKKDVDITSSYLANKGKYKNNPIAVNAYQAWLNDVWPVAADYGYHILDLFYWEIKMPRWAASIQKQYDISVETFSPFNCRYLLETMLSTDEKYRVKQGEKGSLLTHHIIKQLWPELLMFPINPISFRDHIKRYARSYKRFRRSIFTKVS